MTEGNNDTQDTKPGLRASRIDRLERSLQELRMHGRRAQRVLITLAVTCVFLIAVTALIVIRMR